MLPICHKMSQLWASDGVCDLRFFFLLDILHTDWLKDLGLLFTADTSITKSAQHLLLCSESHCHGRVQKHIIFTKTAFAGRSKFNSLLFKSECFCLKIKNSGLWIWVGPSVSLSLGAAMTTPPLSQLRNGFPLFAFLLMLQIANSFLLLLSLSLRWGEKTLICSSRPYINHCRRVKWSELISE